MKEIVLQTLLQMVIVVSAFLIVRVMVKDLRDLFRP